MLWGSLPFYEDYLEYYRILFITPFSSSQIHADVVFVHGLLGGPFLTWRQQDPPIVQRSTNHRRVSRHVTSVENQLSEVAAEVEARQSKCWPKVNLFFLVIRNAHLFSFYVPSSQ